MTWKSNSVSQLAELDGMSVFIPWTCSPCNVCCIGCVKLKIIPKSITYSTSRRHDSHFRGYQGMAMSHGIFPGVADLKISADDLDGFVVLCSV